jgi:anthranilate phosphoribosyltransferase
MKNNNQRILEQLLQKKNITSSEVQEFLEAIIAGEVNPSQIAAFLVALRIKGESVDEIVGLICGMRKHMIAFPECSDAIDVCGTGGDGSGTFNISTTVAFVVAGAGVKVVKHGNRAASSNCGSADVLEYLGVQITLSPTQAAALFKKTRMIFLFAPLYHPAMKHIAPVRKELGIRTVFNYLGPFLNPARVKRQIIGVPSLQIAKTLASVAAQLDYEHVMIVSGKRMDEISLSEKSTIFSLKGKTITKEVIDPQSFGFPKASLSALQGKDIEENARIMKSILNGEKGPRRDIVVLNSAYALLVAGKVKSVVDGIVLAEKSIDSGAAGRGLHSLV